MRPIMEFKSSTRRAIIPVFVIMTDISKNSMVARKELSFEAESKAVPKVAGKAENPLNNATIRKPMPMHSAMFLFSTSIQIMIAAM